MKNFVWCLTFSNGKIPAFRTKIIEYSTFNLNEMTESGCLSEFRFGKETFRCYSCFPYKVYFLYIKDFPKYVQIHLSLTSLLARPPQLFSFFEVLKTIH